MMDLSPTSVLIADDHELYRDGLRFLLSDNPDIRVIDEAANGQELLALLKRYGDIHVVLTDLKMPLMDGIEAIRKIAQDFPSVRSVALTTFDSDNLVVEALEAGALGYVMKNARREVIVDAVRTVRNGEPYYCESTSALLAGLIGKSRFNPYKQQRISQFSDRELDIIRLVCKEKTSKEIAETLFMSSRTVEGFRAKIMEKMHVRTAAGIAIYAIKYGIYKP